MKTLITLYFGSNSSTYASRRMGDREVQGSILGRCIFVFICFFFLFFFLFFLLLLFLFIFLYIFFLFYFFKIVRQKGRKQRKLNITPYGE